MCGIAGVLAARGGADVGRNIDRMLGKIAHRGPDAEGVWREPAGGLVLGHRRLSILDLSPEGRQPMVSACGRFVISFNGEVYNYRALRATLSQRGHKFKGESDTEVLLATISEWGVEPALGRLNGMFAFAVWDSRDKTLYLARDRIGEKPLYYGIVADSLVFASELKSLCAYQEFKKIVNRDALCCYLRYNYIPAPYCIYQGIYKLTPGTVLVIPQGRIELRRPKPYWTLAGALGESAPAKRKKPEGALEELHDLLRDAVKCRMYSDVPLGAFLSGGIDSTLIVALMQEHTALPVKTFTIGFDEPRFDEAPFARRIAGHLGTDHTELRVTADEARDVIPSLPEIFDEPFSDSSQIPTLLVSKLARQGVTVALSGDGGDELFGGYNRYFWGVRIWNYLRFVPLCSRRAVQQLLSSISPLRWDRFFQRVYPFLPRALRLPLIGDKLHKLAQVLPLRTPREMYYCLVSHWQDPASVVLGSREPGTLLTDSSVLDSLPIDSFAEQMMFMDTLTYLPDDILTKVDRASMCFGLEARVPFLDPRVIEYAWQLPLNLKMRKKRGKWILRELLARYVPSGFFERPKQGFAVPIGSWLRGPLRQWGESLLDETRLKNEGYLDPGIIRRHWDEHLQGHRNWQYHLWDILMFQAWLERWIK